ncbi:MAG: peroxide stress protein YaaA [Bacteroidales bacterium]|nr:peroxide stress protein YaaA [Bacteroidales bacterium]
MLSIISPAKTMDYSPQSVVKTHTKPAFIESANELADILVKFSKDGLQSLMGISPKLAELNMQRYQTWKFSSEDDAKQALFAFKGDVYVGLDAENVSSHAFDYMQQHLRILSGLYGVLRPFDLILPHRLEMGTSFANSRGKDLYTYWSETITQYVQNEIEKNNHSHIINLASQEYAKVIDFKQLSVPVITPVFKDYKNGKLKIISFYAKKARGMMVRYMAENSVSKPEDLIGFDYEGYFYDEQLSNGKTIVFTR